MNPQDYIHLEDLYGAHNYHPLDIVLERGEGVWVYDITGGRYLDCLSAYSALNHGHRHPRLIQAAMDQLQKLTLTSRAFRNGQLPMLCKELCELSGYEMFLPMNTGAEAVETALKAARKWAYLKKGVPNEKVKIITCKNNFHGRTITIITFSTEADYRDGFGPFTPGFVTVPYGDTRAFENAIVPGTAAFLVEPIQGEAGVIVPPDGYLREVREICTRHQILLMADEIQTGLGRTGKLFACDHEGVHPDVMIVGKALGGGIYPVSGVLASRDILDVFSPGTHGSTFGGNPLGAAVAREALSILIEEGLIENSAQMGAYFIAGLNERLAQSPSPWVDHIRGKGLFVGVVLRPEAGGARRFCEALKEHGVLCKETHRDIIRFAPPLIINQETIDWALDRIVQVLTIPETTIMA